MWDTWARSLGWKDPLEKGMATHSIFLPGEFHGLYSSWGRKELDTTEQLSLSCIYIHVCMCYMYVYHLYVYYVYTYVCYVYVYHVCYDYTYVCVYV